MSEVHVPPFPESVEEGTLTTWHKKAGETVRRNDRLADIETDKIVLEVAAQEDGVLATIAVPEGSTVKPGQLIATLAGGTVEAAPAPTQVTPTAVESAGDVTMSPAVRRLVEEHGLNPTEITGTGRGGMVTKGDVLKHLEGGAEPVEVSAPPVPPPAPVVETPKPAPKPMAADPSGRPEQRVPMTRIRARIAERLVEAQQTAAILTTFNEVNMAPIMRLRSRYKEVFEKSHGVKLGFMSFFVKAAVDALRTYPVVNATLDGSDIVYHGFYDIGVAVSTERGLVVPIVRDADQLSYAEIEAQVAQFAGRAREGKLTMEDLTGGTFSITNGGIFGSLLSTPILNPPQSAILGMHSIQERPVAEEGQVVIRPMMYLALSYDHRLIDGKDAVKFLVHMKECLEDPAKFLLEL
jgi:2-oxoglutarate dehydrogenase E2 component (dihydrolipoamide succinyltransferase)